MTAVADVGTRQILLSPPDMTQSDRDAMLAAFDSGWVAPCGPSVDEFEREMASWLGARHCVALSSGTAALHLALVITGVRYGDTVLVPSFTFAATANAVMYVGAEPVFVDSSASTWTMDPLLVAEELDAAHVRREPHAAVIPVDIYGQAADYRPLLASCEQHGTRLISDAAEAVGTTYRGQRAGTLGVASVLSFNGNKLLTTGGGGMLVTDDENLAARARHLSTQAREPVGHYEHRDVGYNYRLNNILAAIGCAQLRAVEEKVAARRRNRQHYSELLEGVEGVEFMPVAGYGEPNHWLTCILLDLGRFGAGPEDVLRQLALAGIEARRLWKPMHRQPAFRGHRVVGGAVSDDLFRRGLCLPSGSALTPGDRERVVKQLLATRRTARV